VVAKSPIAEVVDRVEVATSMTEFTSMGTMLRELGVLLLVRGEVGANAPTRGTSATTEQTRERIVMLLLIVFVRYLDRSSRYIGVT